MRRRKPLEPMREEGLRGDEPSDMEYEFEQPEREISTRPELYEELSDCSDDGGEVETWFNEHHGRADAHSDLL